MEKTLLLVDDEENILSSLARLFRRDGYCISCLSGCFPNSSATARMSPIAGIKLGVSWCCNTFCNTQQRAERVERVEAPVESKREFIEVRL